MLSFSKGFSRVWKSHGFSPILTEAEGLALIEVAFFATALGWVLENVHTHKNPYRIGF